MNSAIASWSTNPDVSSVSPFCRATASTSRSGTDQPAEPQPGRQRLARGTHVDHVVGVTAVQRPDRAAVVAELPVVVVFDDHATGSSRPVDDRGPPVGMQ